MFDGIGIGSGKLFATLDEESYLYKNESSLELVGLNLDNPQTLSADIFQNLSSLERLHLQNNDLETLPAGFFEGLSNLQILDLQSNGLKMLPAGIFENLSTLRELHLENNSLQTLPAGIFEGLKKIQILDLRNNGLEVLPPRAWVQNWRHCNCFVHPIFLFPVHCFARTHLNDCRLVTFACFTATTNQDPSKASAYSNF